MEKKVKHITRAIDRRVERELWARAAGRCQFQGCPQIIYKSPITQEKTNLGEMAHIYSFSEDGPRGWKDFWGKPAELNSVENLMLVCRGCHKLIDADKNGIKYSAELLIGWKKAHENRVRIVTGISHERRSHVVLYGGKIGEEDSPLQFNAAADAMFPDRYPADERPIDLAMRCEHEDKTPEFWVTESKHLRARFDREIRPRIEDAQPNHFSVFARSGQPLMILLGALFTDKVPVDVYQLHRDPPGWKWQEGATPDFTLHRPKESVGQPVLALSLSGRITEDRIHAAVGQDVRIWEITVPEPHNRLLRTKAQLAAFSDMVSKAFAEIGELKNGANHVKIFPAMPVACAVELGRVRMPKADLSWVIYDHNNKTGGFMEALTID
jgi:hypothetical protein